MSDDYYHPWEDDDDLISESYDYGDEAPLPDFGCACQNALIVDTVCGSCISYLAEQDRLARTKEPT